MGVLHNGVATWRRACNQVPVNGGAGTESVPEMDAKDLLRSVLGEGTNVAPEMHCEE